MSGLGWKRKVAMELVFRSGVSKIYDVIKSRSSLVLVILAYHRVYDVDSDSSFPFDPGLVSASIDEFRNQLEYIRSNYDVISFNDVQMFHSGSNVLPKKPLIITFDDGYIDNYTNAFRLLKEYSLPGTFYVAGDYVKNRRPFWSDILWYLLHSDGIDDVKKILPDIKGFSGQDSGLFIKYMETLKLLDNSSLLPIIKEIESIYQNYRLPEEIENKHLAMSESHIREMAEFGMEIGSHGMRHLPLSKVSNSDLEFELEASGKNIYNLTGKYPIALSYPFGGKAAFNDRVIKHARKCGYMYATKYLNGVNYIDSMDSMSLARMRVERELSLTQLAVMIRMPTIFSDYGKE